MQLMVQYSGGKICFEWPECNIMTANFSSDRQHVARIYRLHHTSFHLVWRVQEENESDRGS